MIVTYKDTWPKVLGSFIIANFIELIGQQYTLWELLLHRFYYVEVGSGFIIALIIWECISRVTKWLDKKYDWIARPVSRSMLQLGLAIFVPSLLTFLLVNLQFRIIFGQDITAGDWLLYEFPVAILFIVFINITYIGYYFFERWNYSEALLKQQSAGEKPIAATAERHHNTIAALQKTILLVRKGGKVFPLAADEIACIYKESVLNFVKTFKEETFTVDKTLEELELQLSNEAFFRANRQTIIHRNAIRSYMPIENGKIQVVLKSPAHQPLIISQKRAPGFRIWIKQKLTSPG